MDSLTLSLKLAKIKTLIFVQQETDSHQHNIRIVLDSVLLEERGNLVNAHIYGVGRSDASANLSSVHVMRLTLYMLFLTIQTQLQAETYDVIKIVDFITGE